MILEVIATIILIEAMTSILSKSELVLPLKKFLHSSNNRIMKFFHDLLDCPYCTSVWVSLFSIAMLYLYINNLLPRILALFFMGIVLHRLSNILHFIIDRIDSNHTNLDKG
jgi:hypothetical protein